MKKLIGCLIAMTLLPAAFMGGCDKKTTSGPGGPPAPTATPAPYSTPQTTPQAVVVLGTAANYVILAYTGITNLTPPSTICGGLGISPAASVDGGIVEVCGGPNDVANTAAGIAKTDLSTAYTDAAGRSGGATLPPGGVDIGGQTLSPGLYTEAGTLLISSSDLTLDAKGNPNAIFIFQVSQILNVTSGRRVNLIGGAQAKNVFWQVADYCSLGTTVSFVGNILAYNSVTLNTNAVLSGRALGSNGNVTLLANTITKP